jgi:transcriptional regulator with XRE-family HTH domain
MARRRLSIVDEMALSRLTPPETKKHEPSPADWIRILRDSLRMTQAELASRAKITQPHLAGIESGKTDPQISTLKRIFDAMSCDLVLEPRARKPIKEVLRGRARTVALQRLNQSMGTMALEHQAPEADVFRHLLEKRTDEILLDRREKLWRRPDK